jgi:hypothetical protein
MTPEPCVQWRGALALLAFDSLEDRERTSVLAHVEGCALCADALQELRGVTDALRHLDETSLATTALVPPSLASSVLGELRDSALHARRRRHVVLTSIAAALVVIASLVTWVGVSSTPTTSPRRVIALEGSNGAAASALLVARPWGTAITLTEHGLTPGTSYVVSLRSSTGSWWSAGTYRAVAGRTVTVQLSCEVPMREVAGVEVVEADGQPVLRGGTLGASRWPPGVLRS